MDNGVIKVARRSSRPLLRRKMANLLPEISNHSKKAKCLVDDQSPKRKYQVTISVESREIPLADKISKTINNDLNI